MTAGDPPMPDPLTPEDIDPPLLWLLRRAGAEWGTLGVALAAARLSDPAAVVAALALRPENLRGVQGHIEDPWIRLRKAEAERDKWEDRAASAGATLASIQGVLADARDVPTDGPKGVQMLVEQRDRYREAQAADIARAALSGEGAPDIERLREENYLLWIHLNAIREKAAQAQMHGGLPIKKDAMILAETVREWANEAFRQVERLAALARGEAPDA